MATLTDNDDSLWKMSFQEVKKMNTSEELETFMLKHGENIVDTLGGEVDRIEKNLKVKKTCI